LLFATRNKAEYLPIPATPINRDTECQPKKIFTVCRTGQENSAGWPPDPAQLLDSAQHNQICFFPPFSTVYKALVGSETDSCAPFVSASRTTKTANLQFPFLSPN
jgi:hypothetical protein